MFTILRNRERRHFLEDLCKVAPEIPLEKALALANRYTAQYIGRVELEHVITILSETVIGFDSGGNHEKRENERESVKWALRQVGILHAGIACNPFTSMETYLEEKDKQVPSR